MEPQIIKFIDKALALRGIGANDAGEATKFVSSTDEVLLVEAVEYTATHQSNKLLSIMQVISAGLRVDTLPSRVKRMSLIKLLIDFLRLGSFDNHVASGVLCLIFSEIDHLKASEMLELLNIYKKIFKRGTDDNCSPKFIDVFPKLLHALSAFDMVRSARGQRSGQELKAEFIKEFCYHVPANKDNDRGVAEEGIGSEWNLSSVANILTALRDSALTEEEKRWAVLKSIDLLPKLGLDNVPDVVYQLLSLTSDSSGPKDDAFSGICDFFSSYSVDQGGGEEPSNAGTSAREWESLKRSEGLVMLHLMHAVQHNQESGVKLLNILKVRILNLLSAFDFGLLLALSQVGPRIKDQVMDTAKNVVVQHLKEREKKEGSVRIRSWFLLEIDFEKLVKEVAENNDVGFGWEYSVVGLRDLGFTLLETHLAKVIILSNGKLTVESPHSAAYQACLLGKSIIYKCFLASMDLRESIIEQLFDFIATSSSTGRSSTLFVIEALTGLVCRGAGTLLQNERKIVEIFDLLPSFSSDVAVPFMKALLPVIKLSASLRDALVASLKKALFSRNVEAKKTAVGGFMLFLKHFKILNAFKAVGGGGGQGVYWHSFPSYSSQMLTDSRADPQRASYEKLCLEVIGCLRRILAQPAELKEIMYHGLCAAIRRNVSTLQPIVDFLFRHLQLYLDLNAKPPFKLNKCVQVSADDVVTTVEPFGWLLSALTKAVKQADDDKQRMLEGSSQVASVSSEKELYFDSSKIASVRDGLLTLAKEVAGCGLEDFNLDKVTDFSPNATGEANVKMANVLLSTFEALFGVVWSFYDFTPESAEIIEDLHSQRSKLKSDLQKLVASKAKKANVATNASGISAPVARFTASLDKFDTSPLDLVCLVDFVKRLFCDHSPARNAGLTPLRNNHDLVSWVFEISLTKVKDLLSRRKSDSSKIFETICTLSELMLHYYAAGERIVPDMKRDDLKMKVAALEVVAAVLDVVISQFSNKLEEALSIWSNADEELSQASNEQLESKLACYGQNFQRYLKNLLSSRDTDGPRGRDNDNAGDQNDIYRRHVFITISIIETILKQLPRKSDQLKKAHRFLMGLCEDQKINEVRVAKSLWQMVLRVHRLMNGTGELLLDMAKNIRFCFGNISADVEAAEEPERVYRSISVKNASVMATVLFSSLADWRDDCAFLVDHVKHNLAEAKSRKDLSWTTNENLEDALCEYLQDLAEIWKQLATSDLPNTQTMAAMKLLHAFFDTCTAFCRYYEILYQSKLGQFPSKFVEFAQFVGKDLKSFVCKFIGHTKSSLAAQNVSKTKKQSDAMAKQALREMKDVSGLVFAVETFGKHLVELSKKSKVKDFADHIHVGHGLDFRINFAKLEAAHEAAKGDRSQGDNEDHIGADDSVSVSTAVSSVFARTIRGEAQPKAETTKRKAAVTPVKKAKQKKPSLD